MRSTADEYPARSTNQCGNKQQKKVQVAQLLQRDRTAGWVNYGQKYKIGTGGQYFAVIRSIFNHCNNWPAEQSHFGKKMQNKGYYAVQAHRGRFQLKVRM